MSTNIVCVQSAVVERLRDGSREEILKCLHRMSRRSFEKSPLQKIRRKTSEGALWKYLTMLFGVLNFGGSLVLGKYWKIRRPMTIAR
jgi:hypothetical protein